MKMTRLILLCLAAFVLGLVAFIPAELLELPVNRALAGRGQFSAEAGTVWSGQGFLTWREADLPAPIKVRWQWDPLALLQLSAGAHLQWDSAALSGKTAIAVGWGHVDFQQVDLTMDGSLAASLNPVLTLLAPQGTLGLRTVPGERLRFDWAAPLTYAGRLDAEIKNLRLPRFSSDSLGSYDIRLTLHDQQADYVVSDAAGKANGLSVAGNGRVMLTNRRQFSFAGTLAVATNAAPAIGTALQGIGRPLGNGKFTIDYRDSW